MRYPLIQGGEDRLECFSCGEGHTRNKVAWLYHSRLTLRRRAHDAGSESGASRCYVPTLTLEGASWLARRTFGEHRRVLPKPMGSTVVWSVRTCTNLSCCTKRTACESYLKVKCDSNSYESYLLYETNSVRILPEGEVRFELVRIALFVRNERVRILLEGEVRFELVRIALFVRNAQ